MELFSQYSAEEWCEVSSDGSWMEIDTNPNDYDDSSYSFKYWFAINYKTVESAINDINLKLGFNSALIERMNRTTALQGRLECTKW